MKNIALMSIASALLLSANVFAGGVAVDGGKDDIGVVTSGNEENAQSVAQGAAKEPAAPEAIAEQPAQKVVKECVKVKKHKKHKKKSVCMNHQAKAATEFLNALPEAKKTEEVAPVVADAMPAVANAASADAAPAA